MIPTAHVFPIPHFNFKGGLVDPRMRASNEHILIVRIPRAGGSSQLPRPLFFSTLLDLLACVFEGQIPRLNQTNSR